MIVAVGDKRECFGSRGFTPKGYTRQDRSRLKGIPQKDLINIRNYDVRHLIPKVCSAVLKNGAEILIESTVI